MRQRPWVSNAMEQWAALAAASIHEARGSLEPAEWVSAQTRSFAIRVPGAPVAHVQVEVLGWNQEPTGWRLRHTFPTRLGTARPEAKERSMEDAVGAFRRTALWWARQYEPPDTPDPPQPPPDDDEPLSSCTD